MVSLATESETKIKFGGYIPPNVLGYKEGVQFNQFAWYTPPSMQYLLFTKDANIKSGNYYVPGLVWILSNTVNVWAYKEWKELNTELYRAPFLNINDENVCMGTAIDFLKDTLKKSNTFLDVIKGVEDSFWNSRFDHVGKATQIHGSFIDMYEKSKTAFPYDFLKNANKSLKKLIDEHFNS